MPTQNNADLSASTHREHNLTVPFGTFYHPPVQLADVMRDKQCLTSSTFAVMNGLFSLIDFNRTVRIGDHDIFEGWTCIVSYEGIGKRCGLSGRRTQDALKKLESAKLIISEKVGKCKRYLITLYDDSIKYLKENPNQPMKQVSQPVGSKRHQKAVQKIQDEASRFDNDETSDIEPNQDELSSGFRTNCHSIQDGASRTLESYQENLQDPPVSTNRLVTSSEPEPEEKRGDSLNQERQEGEAFGEGKADIQPTKEIADYTDMLTEAKGTASDTPKDEAIWAFMTTFKRPDDEEWQQSDVQPATILKSHFENLLESAPLSMTPIRFFEHCLEEMKFRLEDGKIDVHPSSFNYFLNAVTGQEIVHYCLDKLSADNQSKTSLEKTDAWLDEQKEFKREGIPPDTQAEIDRLLGRT